MWYTEEILETGDPRIDALLSDGVLARCCVSPPGHEVVVLPLSILDPINKVHEEHFFQYVKDSIDNHGLYRPLVVQPIHVEKWLEEAELDQHSAPPVSVPEGYEERLRINNGCNRFFALKELGYTHVDCVIVQGTKESMDVGYSQSIDRSWHNGSNIDIKRK